MPMMANRISGKVLSRQIARTPRPCRTAQTASSRMPEVSSRLVTSQSPLTPRWTNRNWAKVPPTPKSVAAIKAAAMPFMERAVLFYRVRRKGQAHRLRLRIGQAVWRHRGFVLAIFRHLVQAHELVALLDQSGHNAAHQVGRLD